MKVLIAGKGISGKSAYNFLKEKGYEVDYIDDEFLSNNSKIVEDYLNDIINIKESKISQSLNNSFYIDRLLSGLSFIVVSPGIDLSLKFFNIIRFKKIRIIGELELGFSYLKGDIIGITGTNGKTTTTSLIKYILDGIGQKVFIGGNIGTAVTSFAKIADDGDISVIECSSYQLESIENFRPHIAVILNISQDHLLRHKTMENYINAKLSITKNQMENDYLLLNADCEILRNNIPKTRAKILMFSTKERVFGCYIKDNCIYFNDNLTEKKLVSLDNIKLLGEHNLSNIVCAVLAVYLQTNDVSLLGRISQFQGIEHRIEFVRSINGVSFYNDSKATNIDSTLVAVKSFDSNINLILGGSEKGYDFDELFMNLPENVKNIAVFGQTKSKIYDCAKRYGYNNIYKCDSLRECVNICYYLSKKEDVILLSPACASYDHFKNYEERGCVFKKIVKEIDNNEVTLFKCKKET